MSLNDGDTHVSDDRLLANDSFSQGEIKRGKSRTRLSIEIDYVLKMCVV